MANTAALRQHLKDFDFKSLFIRELGWDRLDSILTISVEGKAYSFSGVAQKRGMVAFIMPAHDPLPDYSLRRKIERQITKSAHEHIIVYTDKGKTVQIWQWVKRQPGQPTACREHHFHRNQSGEALIQKLNNIAFGLDEEEQLSLVEVTSRARAGFDVEKVTKRFYDRFKIEHASFLKFLKGIPDEEMQRWYASVMINRLMFIYFVQKKGFLNNDRDYLRNKLKESKHRGKDHYYKDFLCPLFFEGFATREGERSDATNRLLGTVPYLNGGLFLMHQIEEMHGKTIRMADAAFDKLFDFFEQYQWHLDERPLRRDNEINPDVLGYIFEKYINQKQMGAYYTKEDITEYIGKNTIVPFLFDEAKKKCKIAFEGDHSIWKLLQVDPDRYIYDAVKHGITVDIHVGAQHAVPLRLPEDIAAGISDVSKRIGWNRPAPPEVALPTEIWREVVARRQRYEEVRSKLAGGEVHEINDLVTHNLNIRQFAQDVIETCEGPDLLNAFWHAIEKVTVLDPTCGSGAFLFAALNILEPLYAACLNRMEVFLDEWGEQGKKLHPNYHKLFGGIRARLEQHPNERYFILKSIIINNLYGVDIMEEATEICKLRLFLKLVAQIDDPKHIEPLPDIDFNIRAGNTLVGFATYEEVERAVTSKLDFGDTMKQIKEAVEDLDAHFKLFRQQQTELGESITAEDKEQLRKRLKKLGDELDRYLAAEYGVGTRKGPEYNAWLRSHQPFHWFVDFYGIMYEGGFDVIIGNPPYAEIPKNLNRTLLRATYRTALDSWSRDEDLYALVVERSLTLLVDNGGRFGMILPLSIGFSTKRPFVVLRSTLLKSSYRYWWSHFDRIPSALFGNEVRTRNTIMLSCSKNGPARFAGATTPLNRWETETRNWLFPLIRYFDIDVNIEPGIPKVGSQVQARAIEFLISLNKALSIELIHSIPFSLLEKVAPRFPQPSVYVGGTAYNWFPVWRDIPETTNADGQPSLPARTAGYEFGDEKTANIVFALLASSLGYWWWAVASDGFNLKKWLLERFPLSLSVLPPDATEELADLGARLREELKGHYVYKDNKGKIGNFFLPACRERVEEIDTAISKHVPELSLDLFLDIRNFTQGFSRAEAADVEEDGTA